MNLFQYFRMNENHLFLSYYKLYQNQNHRRYQEFLNQKYQEMLASEKMHLLHEAHILGLYLSQYFQRKMLLGMNQLDQSHHHYQYQ